MNWFRTLAPPALTLAAMLLSPSLTQQSGQTALAGGLVLVWLVSILSARAVRTLQFYLLTWFALLVLLLLRIKIQMEGVIELPAVYDWLTSTILVPFSGLLALRDDLSPWITGSLLGSVFCLLISLRLILLHRRSRVRSSAPGKASTVKQMSSSDQSTPPDEPQ